MDSDYHKIARTIKEVAKSTLDASVMTDIEIGEVISVSPLQIALDAKTIIDAEFIILTKNTTMWSVDMDVDHRTENEAGGGGYAEFASHSHGYKGRKTYRVHNELVMGDKVILLRESGGQRYIALDRYYNPDRGCKD